MTYYDRLNQFFRHIVYNEIPPHAQLVYLHLLNHNNQLGWQEKFCITDRRLELLTGLSKQSVTDAKRILKDRFVVINTDKTKPRKGSCYRFINFLPCIQGKLEGKTQGKNEGKSQGKTQGKPDKPPSISVSKIKDREGDGGGSASERAATAASYCSEELRHSWIQNAGFNPNDGICMKLGALEQTYSTAKVKAAIEEANARSDGAINFNFVQSVLMRMINGNLIKGVMTSGKSTRTGEKSERKSAQDYDWNKDMPDLSKYEV